MEEAVAAAVGFEPAAEVVPAADFVDGFVFDEFFEGFGWGVPVDGSEFEEASVEPGAEEVGEVGFGWFEGWVAEAEQVGPHGEEGVDAVGGEVDRSEEFESGRFGGGPESVGVGGSGFGLPGGDGVVDGGRIGGEVVDEEGEEGGFGVVVVVAGEGGVAAYDEFGEAAGGGFVAESGEGPAGFLQHDEFGVGGAAHVSGV